MSFQEVPADRNPRSRLRCNGPVASLEHFSTKNSARNRTGAEFFEVEEGRVVLYVGSFHNGNPHGQGVLFRNLMTNQTKTLVCGMDHAQWNERTNGFKDFSFLENHNDGSLYTCFYKGCFKKKHLFHLQGKGVYCEPECTIYGSFKTQITVDDSLLYKFDGKVRVEYKNQDVFTGFLHDYDVFHPAHGLYCFHQGHTFRGTFPDPYSEAKESYGCYVDGTDQSTYTGSFKNDYKHGNGVLIFKTGERFTGTWSDDVPTSGTLFTPGAKYHTNYEGLVDGAFKPHGNGTLVYYHGETVLYQFTGSFQHGKKHGVGKEVEKRVDGTLTVQGEWKEGKRIRGKETFQSTEDPNTDYTRTETMTKFGLSFGKYVHANGDVYHGNFNRNHQAAGFGMLKTNNGVVSFGPWKKNRKDGVHDVFCPFQDVYRHEQTIFRSGELLSSRVLPNKRKREFEEFKSHFEAIMNKAKRAKP